MNRKIKFRGKRLDNGEWVYGDLWQHNERVDIVDRKADSHPVDPGTVGQYTCLKDRNGVAIYEGDILNHPAGPKAEIKYIPEHAAFIARYMYEGEQTYNYLEGDGVLKLCEIIGNIYENPELLEGEA